MKSNHTVTLPREELEELEQRVNASIPVESIDERMERHPGGLNALDIAAKKFAGKNYDVVFLNGTPYFKQRSQFDPLRTY